MGGAESNEKQRIADLEKEIAKRNRWIDQRDRRIDKLEQENERLRRENEKLQQAAKRSAEPRPSRLQRAKLHGVTPPADRSLRVSRQSQRPSRRSVPGA